MQKFHIIKSKMIPLLQNDIDTDQIIPARYLKVTDKNGLADGLFAGWRYNASGDEKPEFPLNQTIYEGAEILLTGDNFGCGSSREHAPWALVQWGIRTIISTSFADIFRNNALKNGLLTLEVSIPDHEQLMEAIDNKPLIEATIDLPNQTLSLPKGFKTEFMIDAFSKKCLKEGIDPLGYLLDNADLVNSFEQDQKMAGIYRVTTSSDYYANDSNLSNR